MGKNPPKWLPGDRVKETILLQRKSVEQLRANQVLRRDKLQERRNRIKSKIDSKRKKKVTTKKFIPAQTILKHALRKVHQATKFHKIGEKVRGKRNRMPPQEQKAMLEDSNVVLVVRAKGKLIPPEVAGAFRKLGLAKLYAARLLSLNQRTYPLVQQLRPFSFVGVPEQSQLEDLIRTRGHFWDKKQQSRYVISGNLVIEKELGHLGILCVEDLCDAIAQKSPKVEEVLRHLAPFDFHPPHQLFIERHRTVHQKLEVVNSASFAAYLGEQLKKNVMQEVYSKRSTAKAAKKDVSVSSVKRKVTERVDAAMVKK